MLRDGMALGLLTAFAIVVGILGIYTASPALLYDSFGTTDFLEFWSAFQFLQPGGNPYDPDALWVLQKEIGRTQDHPVLLWNPPWVLTLLSPILWLDFKAAFLAFFSVNVALMSLGATLLWSVASKSDPLSPRALLLALGFSGVIDNLQLGQIGLMLFFCVAGFIWAAHHKKYVLAGLFLVPMSVKLHLLFLFLTVLLVWIVQKRHWQILISGALGFVALVGVTVLLSPEVVGQWREAFEVPPFYWRTASLAGATRGALHFLTGEAPIWPLWCFPLVGVIGVLLWLWISKPVLRWEIHAPGLIALSLMASPYGWLFDQTLLLPIHLLLAARALEPGVHRRVRLESLGGLLLVQAVAFGALMNGIVDHRLFFWQPVVLFLLWLRGNRMLSSSAS